MAALAAAPVRAAVFTTPDAALAAAFPGARLERRTLALTPEQARAVEKRARVKLKTRLVTSHLAWRGDSLDGVGLFDTRTMRTMPATLLIVVAPDSTVRRIEVLAFHEPPDYRPPVRWIDRLLRRRLDDRMWPGRDLPNLSGASLSARGFTESTRLALALWEVAVAPSLAQTPGPTEKR